MVRNRQCRYDLGMQPNNERYDPHFPLTPLITTGMFVRYDLCLLPKDAMTINKRLATVWAVSS